MAQEKENMAAPLGQLSLLPKASTDINPGDVLVMPRTADPISISALGPTPGRVEPIAAAREGQWAVGVADGLFTSAAVGATLYATPTQAGAMLVKRAGIVRLALVPTSGKVGDFVQYSSGASGSQLFTIDNSRKGWAIGTIAKDFSGATANDPQYVELIEHPVGGPNLYHFLENRVVDGCEARQHTTAGARSENIGVGYSSTGGPHGQEKNLILIQNRMHSLASNYTLDIGDCSVTGASAIRFRMVVARSGGFGYRTCSGRYTMPTSYTNSAVSALMMVPTTFTAGEIPIALVINFSTPQSYTSGLIWNLRSPGMPNVGSWGL